MSDAAVSDGKLASAAEPNGEAKASPLNLMVGTVVHPAATFERLRGMKHGYWWFVYLVTVLTIIAVTLASSSVQARAFSSFSQRGGTGNFGAGTRNAGGATGNFANAGANGGAANGNGSTRSGNFGGANGTTGGAAARQAQASSPLLLVGLPLAGGVVVTLLDYGVRALIVFLMSMLLGGKAAFKEVFRMAAWTTLPAAIRRVVQGIAVVATSAPIAAGFSAALTAAEARSLPLVNTLLGYIDVYTLWSALLLGIGAAITGKLSKGNAAVTVGIYLGVSLVGILVFYAVSTAVGSALGGTAGAGGAGGTGGGRLTRPGG